MDTATPAKAKSPAEVEAAEEKRSRRLRIPTPVILTILGVALSAWLLPAFTRQWDDRQKARELRVTIAEEVIAKGTGVIYAATKPPLPGNKPAADYDAMLARWHQDSAVIRATLRAYFPADVVDAWDTFDRFEAQQLLYLARALPAARKRHTGETFRTLIPEFEQLVGGEYLGSPLDDDDNALVDHIEKMARPTGADVKSELHILASAVETRPPKGIKPFPWVDFSSGLQSNAVRVLDDVTDRLLAAHMTGFSTTRRDFLRDLLP